MTEVKIFIPEIKMWCEKCHKWTLAERVVFGGHFVDVHCSECHTEQPYKLTTDTVRPKEEPTPPTRATAEAIKRKTYKPPTEDAAEGV